jgi:hypothetical protein
MERRRIPVLAVAMLAFLLGFGIAFVTSSASDRVNSSYEHAVDQARYLARRGIMERGVTYLRSLKPSQLPDHRVDLPSSESEDGDRYQGVYVIPEPEAARISGGDHKTSYIIGATGVVEFEDASGGTQVVSRTETTRAYRVNFASFMHVTDSEHSIFGEHLILPIWGDTVMNGDVHSNDYLRIWSYAVFTGHVTTSAPNLVIEPHGGHPTFLNFPPEFNTPLIVFRQRANEARRCARAEGLFFDGEEIYGYHAVFDVQHGIRVYRNVIGVPPVDSLIFESPFLYDVAMFFDAPLDIEGTVYGRFTIGASGNVRLMDDIIYVDSQPNGEVNPESQNVLGIISENDIVIANTPENGRENRTQGQDIIINAALLALHSFTFEDQNEVWDVYSGPVPDERGTVRLWGSTAQKQRGYVHRSNHGGTGYGRDYHYDTRFHATPPPCFETVIAERNFSQFNIEAWGAD